MSVLTPRLPTPCLQRCCSPLSEPSSCLQVSSFQIWNLRHFLELFPEGQGQALETQRKNVQPLFPIVPGQLLCGAPNPADCLPSSPFSAWPRCQLQPRPSQPIKRKASFTPSSLSPQMQTKTD